MSIEVTTEVRWFFDGSLPREILSWFTKAETAGLLEQRCDSYRHDDFTDIGVKRRFGHTLELKKLLCAPEMVELGGVPGQLETWQRWSPADDLVELAPDTVWVDVDKTVIKRRFNSKGREVPMSEETRPMTGRGCDAEIVAVSVEGFAGWSFAFSGFGARDEELRYVAYAWDALLGPDAAVVDIDFGHAVSCGYPEWLANGPRRPADARPSLAKR